MQSDYKSMPFICSDNQITVECRGIRTEQQVQDDSPAFSTGYIYVFLTNRDFTKYVIPKNINLKKEVNIETLCDLINAYQDADPSFIATPDNTRVVRNHDPIMLSQHILPIFYYDSYDLFGTYSRLLNSKIKPFIVYIKVKNHAINIDKNEYTDMYMEVIDRLEIKSSGGMGIMYSTYDDMTNNFDVNKMCELLNSPANGISRDERISAIRSVIEEHMPEDHVSTCPNCKKVIAAVEMLENLEPVTESDVTFITREEYRSHLNSGSVYREAGCRTCTHDGDNNLPFAGFNLIDMYFMKTKERTESFDC